MTKKNKKRKVNVKKIVFFLAFLFLAGLFFYKVFTVRVTNIYIRGNVYLTDQEIIDISGLRDYPKSIDNLSFSIEKKLEKNIYIADAKVTKGGFINKVYIDIKENYPLVYYIPEDKTILFDGKKIDGLKSSVSLINKVPNTIYNKFLSNMQKVNSDVLNKISEIEYKPNEVDEERFLLIMNDGNYVYLTLNRFLSINKYINMISSFENKKGILYLDSGEYFEVFK